LHLQCGRELLPTWPNCAASPTEIRAANTWHLKIEIPLTALISGLLREVVVFRTLVGKRQGLDAVA
jgi:hypothetical protein